VLTKDDMPERIVTPRTVVRRAMPEDLPQIEAWPAYPWPYHFFNMTSEFARSADGEYWWRRIDRPNRCQYSVILSESGEVIGIHAFGRIDWTTPAVGSMGIRIHPDHCSRGFGVETLAPLLRSVLDAGMTRVRLDVAATNERAIACYRRCGMRVVGEFWQDASQEEGYLDDPRWAFAVPHLRQAGGRWTIRFYLMETDGT
jgi:RimJ/RimL family protein N-acetyltransferase